MTLEWCDMESNSQYRVNIVSEDKKRLIFLFNFTSNNFLSILFSLLTNFSFMTMLPYDVCRDKLVALQKLHVDVDFFQCLARLV